MQIFDRPPPPSRRLRLPRVAVPRAARRPLPWVVAGEVAVCLALVGAAWHLVAATAAAAAAPVASLPAVAAPSPEASPPAVPLAPGASVSVPGRPGLGTGGAFLGSLIQGLNQDQASFENAEWSALQALSAAMRAYIERVMLPAVLKAERSGER